MESRNLAEHTLRSVKTPTSNTQDDDCDSSDASEDGQHTVISPGHSTACVKRPAPRGVISRLATLETREAAAVSQYYYCKLSQTLPNYGCEARFSVYRPRVEKGDHSLAQLVIWNNESGVTQTIEAGWSREGNNPTNNNPNRNASRLFVFFTNSGYGGPYLDNVRGYYPNVHGWNQIDSVLVPDRKLTYSHVGQTPNELYLKFQLVSDRWYLTTEGGRPIGFFECALFRNRPDNTKTLGDHAQIIMFQGEVYDNVAPRPGDTTTDMGSGKFSTKGFQYAAYIRNMMIQPEPTLIRPRVVDLSTADLETSKAEYWDTTISASPGWGTAIYLGGPGVATFDWLDWETIGGYFRQGCPITAISRKEGQIDAFVCGRDGNVYTCFYNEDLDWSNFDSQWTFIGGNFLPGSPVTAVSRQPEIIDLFICGSDKNIYNSYWTPSTWWSGVSGWRSLAGGNFSPGTAVTAISRSEDNLDLFAYDATGTILTTAWQDGADWSGIWAQIGNWDSTGVLTVMALPVSFTPATQLQPIGAVRRMNQNEIMLFICADDGQVYTVVWTPDAGWVGDGAASWLLLGGPGSASFQGGAPVTAVSRKEGNVDIFLCADDGNVYTSWWTSDGKWNTPANSWKSIGGKNFDAHYLVVAVSRLPDQLDVFACSKGDAQPYTSWWPDGSSNEWSGLTQGWKGIPGDFRAVSPASSIAVVSSASAGNRLDMLIVDRMGVVNQTKWAG